VGSPSRRREPACIVHRAGKRKRRRRCARSPTPTRSLTHTLLPPLPPNKHPTIAVTDEAVVEEEANEALWQADWDDEDTSADFQTRLRAELARVAAAK
jgi:hypothetical protein